MNADQHSFEPGDRVEVKFLKVGIRSDGRRWCWRRGTFVHFEGAFARVQLDTSTIGQLNTYYVDRVRPLGLLDLLAEAI